MADSKGSDPGPNDGKTGPVKPPVLDLKPRATGSEKPEARSAKAHEPPPRDKPASSAPTPRPAGMAIGSMLGGAALGLAAAYGLAWFGLWPIQPPSAPAPDPRLARFASAIPELETVTQTAQSELLALNQRIAVLESAAPATIAGTPPELSTIEGDIAALAARIDGLASASASSGDEAAVTALTSRLDEVAARLGTAEAGLRTLDSTMRQTTATLAEQPGDIGAVLQLPLILSGFESAFATGRPYATELAALRAARPQASVPALIVNAAETGLARPDAIASRFASTLPAMLAGRPADPDAQWQDGALDWFRSAIALRPTGEIEGDSPEAVMSRLEGAIARRDFVAAQALFAALPAPMLAAGEDVPALVAGQAEATRFLDGLRASALAGEVGQ